MTTFVLLGVAGVGKSTIGAAVAEQLHLPFIEGDDFHPSENVAKMSAGVALTDEDRIPWIAKLVTAVNAAAAEHVIVSCSALTKSVRDRLRAGIEQPVCFLHLTAPREEIQGRLDQRSRHFMRAGMLASQLATLETPQDAVTIDTDRPLATVIAQVVQHIRSTTRM